MLAALAIAACTEAPDSIGGPNYFPTEEQGSGIVRGGQGFLTESEHELLKGLAWPQTYADMKGSFGNAHRSTQSADVYLVESGEAWVFYDENNMAVGYEFRPKN